MGVTFVSEWGWLDIFQSLDYARDLRPQITIRGLREWGWLDIFSPGGLLAPYNTYAGKKQKRVFQKDQRQQRQNRPRLPPVFPLGSGRAFGGFLWAAFAHLAGHL